MDYFGIFDEFQSIQIVNIARFARSTVVSTMTNIIDVATCNCTTHFLFMDKKILYLLKLILSLRYNFFLRLLNSANTQQSNCLSLPPKKRKNFELNSIVSLLACCFQHLLNNNPVKVFKIRSELIFKSKFLRRGEQKVISFCLQGVQVSLGAIFHTQHRTWNHHPIQWVVKIASRP